ncbi:hypothetical protein [Rossellomorea marisflavi]|uniref:hypothetical protein n=1 Tax=Rossellomorea marisflavi TaxID=189381 RepID=UPI00345C63CB
MDEDEILSWTPRYFNLLMKGARHRQVDQLEFMSYQALFNAKANNSKRITAKKIFDSKKARREIDNPEVKEEKMKEMIKLNEAFKGFKPTFIPKKGG